MDSGVGLHLNATVSAYFRTRLVPYFLYRELL